MSKKTKKVSRDNATSKVLEQMFRTGFMSGLAYRGSPKYDPKDPEALSKAMEACDQMYSLAEEDTTVAYDGQNQIKSLARILGLSMEEPKK